ncbi:MAG: hypothetical protein ACXAC8_13190 [Candidatus Hodarchaeales archaeon]
MIFWYYSRGITADNASMTPVDLGLTAEFVEIPLKKNPINAWFFPSDINSQASILIVPNWYDKDDHENNLKTAGILNAAGYNVLLPIFHWSTDENFKFVFKKRNLGPKHCQQIGEAAYGYLLSRPEISRKSVALWANQSGTIIACKLIKNLPIKAIILEDGPVTLWNRLAQIIEGKMGIPFGVSKFILISFLFPFLWRTRWQSKGAVKDIGSTPSFLIATREDPKKYLWQTYNMLYKPRQLWLEHSISPKTIRDTWIQEYFLQVKAFLDLLLNGSVRTENPELHSEFSTKRLKRGSFLLEIQINSIPPQKDPRPLQIILSDDRKFAEYRIWFSGASTLISHKINFKPNNLAIITFKNVEPEDLHPQRQWIKRDTTVALNATIEKLIQDCPHELDIKMDRYFFIKSVIQNELNLKKEAKLTLKSIKSRQWRTIVKSEADLKMIFQDKEGEEELNISTPDLPFLTG